MTEKEWYDVPLDMDCAKCSGPGSEWHIKCSNCQGTYLEPIPLLELGLEWARE